MQNIVEIKGHEELLFSRKVFTAPLPAEVELYDKKLLMDIDALIRGKQQAIQDEDLEKAAYYTDMIEQKEKYRNDLGFAFGLINEIIDNRNQ